jgi:UDP:flavonoid glycosyltransferase YjiC (YdhE family)
MHILIASMPLDGHFNPLRGPAVHLQQRGHDVRWYTAPSYSKRLDSLGIVHLPFSRAQEVNAENLTRHFPEYEKLGLGPKAIAFSLEKIFFGNLEAHLHDILEIHEEFPFEAILFDAAFYAGRLVAEKLQLPAYPLWPAPTPAPVSKTAPPPFFGLKPMAGPVGRLRDALVMKLLSSSTRNGMRIWHELREREGLPRWDGSVFDIHNESSRALFMVGAPEMDFPRADWPDQLRFVGALQPQRRTDSAALPAGLAEKLDAYAGRVVVVSQGTVDNRDPEKLIVPTLTALVDSEYLVIATTGGRHTDALARRFSQANITVVDHIDYAALMPRTSAFVSNGGYGSVMFALQHGVPLVLAGKLEGKNDINARMAYLNLGIDLRTERPSPKRIVRALQRIQGDSNYRETAARLARTLAEYDGVSIIENTIVGANSSTSRGDLSPKARAS